MVYVAVRKDGEFMGIYEFHNRAAAQMFIDDISRYKGMEWGWSETQGSALGEICDPTD